ncbi:LysR family transcriptional regulator [Puniceicoccaceae bacterium K14]|nr:LysR family transcriptional regulator [Puniceicoccaceae bacterium K14]
MELNQLRSFAAIVSEGNFTKAAVVRNVSQPSLSYQISALEDELGEPLFRRLPRRAELTEAGKRLYQRTILILQEEEKIQFEFQQREAMLTGNIVFGVIPTIAPYLLPPLLTQFRKNYPKIKIRVRESRTSQLIQEVVEERIDFAIVSDIEKNSLKRHSLSLTSLFSEELVVALPYGHPINHQSDLSPQDLPADEMILLSEGNCLRNQTLKICRPEKSENQLVCEQLPTLEALVSSGLGFAIVPALSQKQGSIQQKLTYRSFNSPPPKRTIGLLKRRSRKMSAAATEFSSFLHQFAADLI